MTETLIPYLLPTRRFTVHVPAPRIIATIAPEIVPTVAGAAARVGGVLALVVVATKYVDRYGASGSNNYAYGRENDRRTVVISMISGTAV